MLEPVGAFLDGDEIQVQVVGVQVAQGAGGVVIHDARGVEVLDDGLGLQPAQGVLIGARADLALGVVPPVGQVGIGVAVVAQGVVVHGIHDDGGMVAGHAGVERGVPGIAVASSPRPVAFHL